MNTAYTTALKALKSLYGKIDANASNFGRNWKIMPAKEYANDLIYGVITGEGPAMIARLGSNELTCMVNYLGVHFRDRYKSVKGYVSGKTPPWWWNGSVLTQMQTGAGFFPADARHAEKFCELMIASIPQIDVLGSWLKEESFFDRELSGSKKVMLEDLEPFFCKNPWTRALEGKKVLIVHPFDQTIRLQFQKRRQLFDNNLLPDFDLTTIKAVQSIAKEKTRFQSWFEALEFMKGEISRHEFDICILGCGAYGLPLAAFIKQMGKKAVHLGGVTQLLFGIKGRRWENYIVYPYTNLYNEHWVRPGAAEKPENASIVEGACYW